MTWFNLALTLGGHGRLLNATVRVEMDSVASHRETTLVVPQCEQITGHLLPSIGDSAKN